MVAVRLIKNTVLQNTALGVFFHSSYMFKFFLESYLTLVISHPWRSFQIKIFMAPTLDHDVIRSKFVFSKMFCKVSWLILFTSTLMSFGVLNVVYWVLALFDLMQVHEKKSHEDKYGKRNGHNIGPPLPINLSNLFLLKFDFICKKYVRRIKSYQAQVFSQLSDMEIEYLFNIVQYGSIVILMFSKKWNPIALFLDIVYRNIAPCIFKIISCCVFRRSELAFFIFCLFTTSLIQNTCSSDKNSRLLFGVSCLVTWTILRKFWPTFPTLLYLWNTVDLEIWIEGKEENFAMCSTQSNDLWPIEPKHFKC